MVQMIQSMNHTLRSKQLEKSFFIIAYLLFLDLELSDLPNDFESQALPSLQLFSDLSGKKLGGWLCFCGGRSAHEHSDRRFLLGWD